MKWVRCIVAVIAALTVGFIGLLFWIGQFNVINP